MTDTLEDIFMRQHGYNYDEAVEAKRNLVGFFSLLLEIDREQKRKLQNTEKDTESEKT